MADEIFSRAGNKKAAVGPHDGGALLKKARVFKQANPVSSILVHSLQQYLHKMHCQLHPARTVQGVDPKT